MHQSVLTLLVRGSLYCYRATPDFACLLWLRTASPRSFHLAEETSARLSKGQSWYTHNQMGETCSSQPNIYSSKVLSTHRETQLVHFHCFAEFMILLSVTTLSFLAQQKILQPNKCVSTKTHKYSHLSERAPWFKVPNQMVLCDTLTPFKICSTCKFSFWGGSCFCLLTSWLVTKSCSSQNSWERYAEIPS